MNLDINPSDYKLFAFDLDGTLIQTRKPISPFTKQVLERLRAKGYQYTIATGRILSAVKSYADELQIDIPLIMSNGSILQTRQGKLISQTCLPLDVVQDTIQASRTHNCDLILYICDQIYVVKMTDNMLPVYGETSLSTHKVGHWETIQDQLLGVNKCVIIDTSNEQNLVEMEGHLHKMLNGRAATLRTSPTLLEVQPNGITKANGLRELAEYLGIQTEEIIAFGDYDNDAEMLKAAGLGIAVGDATPACLANADLLVASVADEGPAHFLEDHFLVD